MNRFRFSGACLLLIAIAAALSTGGLAEVQKDAAGYSFPSMIDGADSGSTIKAIVGVTSTEGNIFSASAQETSPSLPISMAGPERTAIRSPTASPATTAPATTTPTTTSATQTPATSTAASTTTQEAADATAQEAETATEEETSAASSEVTETPSTAAAEEAEDASAVTETPEGTITPDMISENSTEENATVNETASNETATNETSENVTAENETENVSEETTDEAEEAENAEQLANRIWREGHNKFPFTWSPKSFSGFFYDLEDEIGTENLTIENVNGRTIEEGDLKYETRPQSIGFEFDDWGDYQVIGFMADKYFAGYEGAAEGIVDREGDSILDEGQLRKVLLDDDTEHSITTGSVLPLEEGYELRIKEIDIDGNKVWLALAQDGEEIDSKVITPESGDDVASTYAYEIDVGGRDIPLILAHVNNVFASAESSLVTIDGLFQISDTYTSVEDGDEYGAMKVVSVDSTNGIEMDNDESISLRRDRTVNIMGDVNFEVADSDVLRFAPYVERTGTYEIRGTVINPNEDNYQEDGFTWDPYNFEGFYYDIDDDVGTETLRITRFAGNSIEEGDLRYETAPQSVGFEFDDWGNYSVIGFLASKYFAGYDSDTEFTDQFSIIDEGQLRRVLVDSDDEQTITTGSVLGLEEGYELRIKEVDLNGNRVWLAIAQDGEEVDSRVVTPSSSDIDGSTYVYEVSIGSEDVPIIAAHVSNVFRGTEADLATIDAVFQVSDSPASVEEGERYSRMEVDSVSGDSILMSNEGSISLGRGRTIEIMDGVKFRVADADSRNFAPIAERTAGTEAGQLNISIPAAVANEVVEIHVTSSGNAVDRAQVLVEGEDVGLTDSNGTLTYLPSGTGPIEVTARKAGYADATAQITTEPEEVVRGLTLGAPPEVLKGESFLVTVAGGANQTPIEGAEVYFDGSSIGTTNAQGTVTYASNETGEFTIRATADNYDEATRNITVSSAIQVTGLNVSEKSTAGQNVQVKATVQNAGGASDTKTLELRVNGQTVETKDVTLGAGENETVTFDYKPMEPGVYRFEVDGYTATTTAEKASTNFALIAAILVLIIIIGAGFYLYRTGELDNLRQRIGR